jgi:hypothetical protein
MIEALYFGHLAILAGRDFFTVETLNWRGLMTYYVVFFLQLETWRLTLASVPPAPHGGVYHAEAKAVDDTGCRPAKPLHAA